MKNKIKIIGFLKLFKKRDSFIQICLLNRVLNWSEAIKIENENIYFVDGLEKLTNKRVKDIDIKTKHSFVLDLDIRNNSREKITDTEIKQKASDLLIKLKGTEFNFWGAIVFTGNGLQIHYIINSYKGDNYNYSIGVKNIYKQWNKLVDDDLVCDMACSNISRLKRLPGTVNMKTGKYSELLYIKKDCISNFNIKKLAEIEYEKLIKIEKKRQIELNKKIAKYNTKTSLFYEEINKIPIYLLAELLIPRFKFNYKRNFKNNKGGFVGYFYIKEINCICNGGSRHFLFTGNNSSCWNCFSLVKYHLNLSNKETFNFFNSIRLGKNT